MFCLVCGKQLKNDTASCPLCEFPVIEIVGDVGTTLKNLDPQIREHRKKFADSCSVGVVLYKYKFNAAVGKMRPDGEIKSEFGKLSALLGKTTMLSEEFDEPVSRDSVDISLFIKTPHNEENMKLSLPSKISSKKVRLGIDVYLKDSRIMCRLTQSGGDDNRELHSEERAMF